MSGFARSERNYLLGALEVFRAIPVDVVMGPNGFFQLVANDESRTFRGWTSGKQHDARTSVRKSSLLKLRSDSDRDENLR